MRQADREGPAQGVAVRRPLHQGRAGPVTSLNAASGRAPSLALWLYGVAAVAFALDRVTKIWVESSLADRAPIDVIPGVLRLTYTTNSGGAFGLGGSAPWLFAGATILVSLAIVIASTRLPKLGVAVALGLILG